MGCDNLDVRISHESETTSDKTSKRSDNQNQSEALDEETRIVIKSEDVDKSKIEQMIVEVDMEQFCQENFKTDAN